MLHNFKAHRVKITGALVSGGMAVAALVVPIGTAAHADPQVTQADVEKAYDAAEKANEAVNAAKADQQALEKRIDQISDDVASVQKKYDAQRSELAASIVQQQVDQPLGPTVSLLASDDPTDFLSNLATLDALNTTRSEALLAFEDTASQLKNRKVQLSQQQDKLAAATQSAEDNQQKLQSQYQKAKDDLARLTAAQQAALTTSNSSPATVKNVPAITDVDPGSASDAAKTALKFAIAQIGDPYVYGATGPNSWDCSGLMLGSYAAAGISLPRTAAAQLAATTPISRSELRPGDLVGYASGSHIGMYVGNGIVVHAPHPGKTVEYTSISYGFTVYRRVV